MTKKQLKEFIRHKREEYFDNNEPAYQLNISPGLRNEVKTLLKNAFLFFLEPTGFTEKYVNFLYDNKITLDKQELNNDETLDKVFKEEEIIIELLLLILNSKDGRCFLKNAGFLQPRTEEYKQHLEEKGLINPVTKAGREYLKEKGIIKDTPFQIGWIKQHLGHFLPKNELGTIVIFLKYMDNWFTDIIAIQNGFPDLILETKDNGKIVKAELEYKSANFKRHKHDPTKCDYVICWEHNCKLPIPVIELKTKRIIVTKQT